MNDDSSNAAGSILSAYVNWVQDHAVAVAWGFLVATILAGGYAATHIGVNSDNPRMMSDSMPARQNFEAFNAVFPSLENALLVVVDGETPEVARSAARKLADGLAAQPETFRDVDIPGAGEFFERHGLLYQPIDDLEIFAEQIVTIQPLLASLEREPTLENLLGLIQEGLEATDGPLDTPEEWSHVLDRFSEATVKVYREYPVAVSWEDLALEGSPVESETRYTIVVDPVLDFGSVTAAARPMSEIRRIASELGLDEARGVKVRITGHPALNYEEMLGILWDVGAGIVFFLGLVLLVLYRALSSFRLMIAALMTLLCGLVLTTAFAAAAVGDLSLMSVTFAILFIGLGVDFTIHLGMAYSAEIGSGARARDAMENAIAAVGTSFLICTLTTAMGFFVFIPTENLAIAELGVISGTGMVINLFVTVTLFPALLTGVFHLEGKTMPTPRIRVDGRWRRGIDRNPRRVAAVAFALLPVAAVAGSRVTFDANVLNLRDPSTESVETFEDLVDESGERSPWPIDAVAEDLEAADAMARRVETLDVVSHAAHLGDYVPDDQEDKLDILADLGFLLDAAPPAIVAPEPLSPEEQIQALRAFRDYLQRAAPTRADSSLGDSMRLLEERLGGFLDRADEDPGAAQEALVKLEAVLISGVPELFERLRLATTVEPITLDGLPRALKRRMIAEDGRARVQIFPREVLSSDEAFNAFADQVTEVIPTASGIAVNVIALGHATRTSFQQAVASALLLIACALLLLWRRITPVLLVLAPLVMTSTGTIGVMALLGQPLNLLNVLVIPLLLGIGVDSGIHLVHRAEHPVRRDESLLGTTTARAVFFSALTTTMSFGTLALSSHRGIAGLGVALTIGMGFTVVCNLIVLPALLALRKTR